MQKKIVLEVATTPHVEIDFMNNTHAEEIEMVKDLGELISTYENGSANAEEDAKEITLRLNSWLEHTVAHFERESKLMQETGFPAYGVHAGEHEIALDRMKSVVQAWEQNGHTEPLADFTFSFWPNWFNQHVNSMDMMTAAPARLVATDKAIVSR
jgi:hemerythrin